MSQRRGLTVLSAQLAWTIVGLCSSSLFSLCRPIIFSSICYSHLNYGLAPRVGHSVSEPGLLRPGKTRRSQTNKKPKRRRRAAPNLVPVRGTSREHPQRNLQNVSPSFFSPSLHLSPPFKRYVLQMTEPSPNAPKMPLSLCFFSPPSLFFPPLMSLCLEPAHMDWDQFRMKW